MNQKIIEHLLWKGWKVFQRGTEVFNAFLRFSGNVQDSFIADSALVVTNSFWFGAKQHWINPGNVFISNFK